MEKISFGSIGQKWSLENKVFGMRPCMSECADLLWGTPPISGNMPARRWVVQLLSVHGILLFLEETSLNMCSFLYIVSASTPRMRHVFDNFGCIASFCNGDPNPVLPQLPFVDTLV